MGLFEKWRAASGEWREKEALVRRSWSWVIRSGFRAPPPETMSWEIFVRGRTKRWRASAMEAAVK